jgi:hypothetical protein
MNDDTEQSALVPVGPTPKQVEDPVNAKDGAPTDTTPQHPLSSVIASYLSALKNISQTVQIVMPHLQKWLVEEMKKTEKKLSHFIPDPPAAEEFRNVNLDSARDFAEFMSTVKRMEELTSNRSLPVLARSLFMQLFCEFDAFLGSLLKCVYLNNTNLLKGITREISLSDILAYENLDAVKRAMLEKEIETFRRDSYIEQFGQLEKKFGIAFRKFPEWSEFVELGQRRNIFVHNDGMVSDQYLIVCEREGLIFTKRPSIGDVLHVDIAYFGRALRVMSKVGYMLTHTLWSKLFPKELEAMHDSLNECVYTALEDKRWKLAAELGDFALTNPMTKGCTEVNVRIRVVNAAIAFKFGGDEHRSSRLLRSYDWSASYRDFKLANLVLEDNFDEAIKVMESIGKSGEIIRQHSYHTWPLFHKFRERSEFYMTYERIYNEPYLAHVPKDGKDASISVGAGKAKGDLHIERVPTPKRPTRSTLTKSAPAPERKKKLKSGIPPIPSTGV